MARFKKKGNRKIVLSKELLDTKLEDDRCEFEEAIEEHIEEHIKPVTEQAKGPATAEELRELFHRKVSVAPVTISNDHLRRFLK